MSTWNKLQVATRLYYPLLDRSLAHRFGHVTTFTAQRQSFHLRSAITSSADVALRQPGSGPLAALQALNGIPRSTPFATVITFSAPYILLGRRFLSQDARSIALRSTYRKPAPGRSRIQWRSEGTSQNSKNSLNSTPNSPTTSNPSTPKKHGKILGSLPNLGNRFHRPTKEEFLAAATGFWSRLRVRFKWFSIRDVRPFNFDDISAFFSWILVGHLIWIVVGTTTFFSLLIYTANTVFAQG